LLLLTSQAIHSDVAKDNEINIFPNPNSGHFLVDAYGAEIKSIYIYNFLGVMVHEINQTNTKSNSLFEVDLSSYPNGEYLLEIQTNNYVFKKKIIKAN
jgi:hypothetical protein